MPTASSSSASLGRRKRLDDPLGYFTLTGVLVKQVENTIVLSNVMYDRYYENNETESIRSAKVSIVVMTTMK